MTRLDRWKDQHRPLARAVDLPTLAVVVTIQIGGIALIALLASRI